MQVANDVASANELPSSEARPGRRVDNPAAAGKLQGGELREDCVKGALEHGLAGRERGVRGVRGQQRRVGLGPLNRRDAGVPASKLRCEEGGVQGCRGDCAQEGRRYLRVHLREQCVRGQGAGVRLGGLQPRDGGVSARELAGQRCGGDGLGVDLQRRDPRRYV